MRAITFNGDYIVRATPVNVMLPTGYMMPKVIMQAALDDYMEEYVKPKLAFGELTSNAQLDDPGYTVNLTGVSHTVTGYNWWHEPDSTTLYIHVRPLDTPKGQMLKELIAHDIPLRAAYRGEGSIISEVAAPNFKLICFDITLDENE